MLEEPAEDADDADVRRSPRELRAEAADAADDEVDFDAGLGGPVERLDRLGIDERVHLGDDAGRAPRARMDGLALDERQHVLAHPGRRHDQLAILALAREAGQRVEEVADVGAERLLAREQPDVGVHPRRARVVVAGGDVHVAADAVELAPDDERDLGMRLEAGHAVGDVDAERLERARPVDVVRLLEPGLQLDEHRDLDAALRGLAERAHDRPVTRRAIQRHLDREHVVVARGRRDELLDGGRERVERVVHQQVALADDVEDGALRIAELRPAPPA